jgi:hypothetical protein
MTCPLIGPNGNSIGALFPNGGGGLPTSNQWSGLTIYNWDTAITNYDPSDSANAKQANKLGYTNGWVDGGTNTIYPGQAIWVLWNGGTPTNVTFVGTVPQNGSSYMTNTLVSGFNMVASAIPMDGDLSTNTNTLLTGNTWMHQGDAIYAYDPGIANYDSPNPAYSTKHGWGGNDPVTTNLTEGFWYFNNTAGSETWVENFSVNQ